MMFSSITSLAVSLTVCVSETPGPDVVWLRNVEQAVQAAKVENKGVLASFLGPDWDPASKFMRSRVLYTPEFADYVANRFVCVEIRFADRQPLSQEECRYNTALKNHFRIQSYPCVILLDTDGRPYAQLDGAFLDVAACLAQLEQSFNTKEKFDALMHSATAEEGMKRAGLLAHGLELIPENLQACYEPVMREIVTADPADTLGFARKLNHLTRLREQCGKLDMLRDLVAEQKFEDADAMVDEMLASKELLPEIRQKLLARYQMHRYAVRKKDMKKAYEILREAHDADPFSEMAPKLKEQIVRMKIYAR